MPKLNFVVYKVTFPNHKIYVGMDIGGRGHSIRYFGTWNTSLVEADFTQKELRDFTLRKEILFESTDKLEVRNAEKRFIVELGSNDPKFGYNEWPKL